MRILLHIGVEKTGTSTIQESLTLNRKNLAEYGYEYLHMEGRNEYRDLPAYCMNPSRIDNYFKESLINDYFSRQEFDNNFIRDFRSKMMNLTSSVHTVIISSEHLSSRLKYEDEIQRLKRLLSDYSSDIDVLVYIRNQVDKAISNYSTKIKSGGSLSLDKYLVGFSEEFSNHYDELLRLWEGGFGKQSISVRLFDHREFINGDLLDDFYHALDSRLIQHLDYKVSPNNLSLSATGIGLARYVNKIIPKFKPGKGVSRLNRTMITLISKHVGGRKLVLSNAQKRDLRKRFEFSNEQVRKRYFPERSELFRLK